MQSSNCLHEQSFAELAKSDNSHKSSLNTLNSSSFLSFEELESFTMEDIQISYEVIHNQSTSNNKFNLLKIINESDVQNQNNYYCIIVNFIDEQLKQKIKIDVSRYSFEINFFDFTELKDQKDTLFLSDSFTNVNKQLQQFRDCVSINSQFCRVIVFSQDLDERIINLIHFFPYIYYFTDYTKVNEEYLEGIKLHQQFQLFDLNYKTIKHLIQSSLSKLKDIKYAGIQIKGQVDNFDQIFEIIFHPLFDYQKIKKNKIFFNYNIPFIIANSYFYLPIPLIIKALDITDYYTFQFQQRLSYISFNPFEMEGYEKFYLLLNALQDQIKKDELFFSINSNKEFNSIDSLLTLNQFKQIQDLKYLLKQEDEYLNLLEKILIYFSQSLKTRIEKYILFVQLKQHILYRYQNSNLIY
ncbi:unnamed protein product [Paramecium sonneborni]|uniref:Uncharacterized protein n=1 Tax=Paramecium sonneborni TaxID=65129 RepID=A0A8S1K152_9CILI|nr:unnamed protein product [Paramecium sonneborni]